MKGTKNPINLLRSWKYRKKNKKKTFPYYGIWAYMGEYGSGKTLSVVNKVTDILKKYPEATFITNTAISGVGNETYTFTTADELIKAITDNVTERNEKGYVILIDEIHVVLSELFGTSDPTFLMYLSQLRKFGIIIIGTCQLYNKCPKIVRDYLRQGGQIIYCKKVFGGITINQFVDMETAEETANLKLNCKVNHWEFFFHTPELYQSYDTFAVITQIKQLMKKGGTK